MKLVAQLPQPVASGAGGLDLAQGQEAALARLAEAGHLVPGAGDPQRGLEVAQSALALLDVRLEQPDRSAVPGPPSAQLLELLLDELLDLAGVELGDDGALQLLEEGRVPRQQPAVEKRRARGVIVARQGEGFLQRAGAEAGFQPRVPKGAMEALRHRFRAGLPRGVRFLRRQKGEEVDVGARGQLAPPIAAGRDQRQIRGRAVLRDQRGEHVLEDGIGQVGDRSDDLLASRAAAVAGEDLGASGIEALPCLARLGADGTGGRGWRRGRRRSFRDWTLGRRRHVASIAVRADGVR